MSSVMAYSAVMNTMVDRRKRYLKSLIMEMNRSLENAPPGKLRIIFNHKNHQYYHRLSPSDKSGKYIPVSDFPLVKALVQKEFDQCVLKLASEELKKLENFSKPDPGNIFAKAYESMPVKIRELLDFTIETDQEFISRWISQPVKGNEFRNENKRYLSSSGVSYRSKSECLMAEIFAALGLLFFYEKELILDTRDPDNPIYPGFTILDVVNRTEIYWEHFGKMDDWSYNEKAVRKIMEYQRNGIMLGERLIVTFESNDNPIDLEFVRRVAERIACGLWHSDCGDGQSPTGLTAGIK